MSDNPTLDAQIEPTHEQASDLINQLGGYTAVFWSLADSVKATSLDPPMKEVSPLAFAKELLRRTPALALIPAGSVPEGWRPVKETPATGGPYQVGGYVSDGSLPRRFVSGQGYLIKTLDGPEWSQSGTERFPIQYWFKMPSHPEYRAASPAPPEPEGAKTIEPVQKMHELAGRYPESAMAEELLEALDHLGAIVPMDEADRKAVLSEMRGFLFAAMQAPAQPEARDLEGVARIIDPEAFKSTAEHEADIREPRAVDGLVVPLGDEAIKSLAAHRYRELTARRFDALIKAADIDDLLPFPPKDGVGDWPEWEADIALVRECRESRMAAGEEEAFDRILAALHPSDPGREET